MFDIPAGEQEDVTDTIGGVRGDRNRRDQTESGVVGAHAQHRVTQAPHVGKKMFRVFILSTGSTVSLQVTASNIRNDHETRRTRTSSRRPQNKIVRAKINPPPQKTS